MNKILSIISLIFSVLGAFLIGYMLIGHFSGAFAGENGMAILAFQFWGAIFTLLGFVLSTIAFFIAANKQEPLHKLGKISRLLALATLAAFIIALALD